MDKRLAGLVEAANAGNPQALTYLAHVQALGVFTPRDLDAALKNLSRAASLGWREAIDEEKILARDSSIEPELLRRPPVRRTLLERPRVRVFEGFATPQECDWLIARGRSRLQPAKVYEDSGTEAQHHAGRSNSEADFDLQTSDIVLSLVLDRIARASGVPFEHFEVGKLLHYRPGQTFMRHSDFLQPGMHEEIEARGQRVATFLTYLSDDYDGGETEFTEVGYRFKARKGDALMFLNVDANAAPDPMSMHAGLPPTRGEKWVLSLWLRGKPVNAYRAPNVTGAPLPEEWYRSA